jgi:hypothetical protein
MPIHLLLQNHAFGPEAIAMMVTAFEDALRELQLVDRADPAGRSSPRRPLNWRNGESETPNDCASKS